LPGFIAKEPMESETRLSVMGDQRGPVVALTAVSASRVFQTPPPEVAR